MLSHRRQVSGDLRGTRDLTMSKRLLLVKEWGKTDLHLDNMELTELPANITDLIPLEDMSLRDNSISSLPDSFSQLTNLKVLDLGHNKFTEIPPPLLHLPSLEKILLNDNEITKIPHDIARLTTLKTLFLAFNKIPEIPDEIAQLVNLESLMIEGNQLTSIPDAITKLSKLSHIYIWNNQIPTFPKILFKLPSLSTICIEGNLIDEFDDELWSIVTSNKYTIKHSLPCQFAPRLFLGDSTAAQNLRGLKKANITHILVLDGTVLFPDEFTYKVKLIDDSPDQDILSIIDELHDYIDSALAETSDSGSVMIHCGLGVSRSPCIAVSYLMKRRGLSFDAALAEVRKRRPSAQPNPGFVRQLQSLEASN